MLFFLSTALVLLVTRGSTPYRGRDFSDFFSKSVISRSSSNPKMFSFFAFPDDTFLSIGFDLFFGRSRSKSSSSKRLNFFPAPTVGGRLGWAGDWHLAEGFDLERSSPKSSSSNMLGFLVFVAAALGSWLLTAGAGFGLGLVKVASKSSQLSKVSVKGNGPAPHCGLFPIVETLNVKSHSAT